MYSEQSLKADLSSIGCYLAVSLNEPNFKKYKAIKGFVEDMSSFLVVDYTNSGFDYFEEHERLKYLVRNHNNRSEIKYRIGMYGNIYNFVDYQNQTSDKCFNYKIKNILKIVNKILSNRDLLWTDVELFLTYSKWPKESFKQTDSIYFKFVPYENDEFFYTKHSVEAIKKFIQFRLGIEE